MPVGAAIIGGTGLVGSLIGANAASDAAKTQANAATTAGQYQLQAAQQAAQLQLGMFNTIRGDLAPYRSVGADALPGYRALLGIPAGSPQTVVSPGAYTGASSGLVIPGVNDTGAGAPPQMNFAAYVANNPDLLSAYQSQTGLARGKSMEQFGQEHWQGYGQGENRSYTPTTAYETWAAQQQQNPAASGGAAPGSTAPGTTAAPALSGADIQSYLESLPGYQFTKDQGMQAITNQLSAAGLGGVSGAYGKGLARFVTGLADQTYGEQLNRLAGAVGTGANASVMTGNAGTSAAQGAAGSLVGGAGAYGSGLVGAANASAGGMVGAANAISGGLSSVGNGYLTSKVLGMYGNPAVAAGASLPLGAAGVAAGGVPEFF